MRLGLGVMWLCTGCGGDDLTTATEDSGQPTVPTGTCVAVPEQCDGIDNDCDGQVDEGFGTTWYPDRDGDGLGVTEEQVDTCTPPPDHVAEPGDCDDTDAGLTGPVGAFRFRDTTAEAGVDWLHWDPSLNPCTYESLTGGAAVADYNNDGWLDIFFPRVYSQDLLFRNQGDGTFREVSNEAGLDDPQSASVGAVFFDIDGDRDLDLYVTSLGPTGARLWVNHGPGTFTEESVARGAALDLGGGDCSLTFSASAADVDGDGDLDLHTAAWFDPATGSTPRSRLLLNNGFGDFTDATLSHGIDLSTRPLFTSRFEDVDLDGLPDLLAAADEGQTLWWRNVGGTGFTAGQDETAFTDEDGSGSAVGDIDGDGDLDWFVSGVFDPAVPCPGGHGCSGNRLYRNDAGRFVDATDPSGVRDGGWGWGATFADHDLDGDLDLIQASGFDLEGFDSGTGRLWRNDGRGVFTDATCESAFVDRGQGRSVVPLDYDGDGDLDLFVVHNGALPTLWRNEGAEANGALRVVLEQPATNNRYAIGAKVRVIPDLGDDAQTRWITANSGFSAAGPPEAHFGLAGANDAVAEVLVTWPDGNVTSFTNVGPGLVTLTRP